MRPLKSAIVLPAKRRDPATHKGLHTDGKDYLNSGPSEQLTSIFRGRRGFRGSGALISAIAVVFGVLAAGLLTVLHGTNPLTAYRLLIRGGFACPELTRCNLLTTLQFATPLLFSGLSAAVAFRSGLINLGQAGQMVLGAGAAGWVGSHLEAPPNLLAPAALMAGLAAGAVWGGMAGLLRVWIGVNEVIATLIMNPLAFLSVGLFGFGRISAKAELSALLPGSKVTAGLALGILAILAAWLWFEGTATGYGQRMQANAPRFAVYGGVQVRTAMGLAMFMSGGLAGLGGAVETLGVHFRLATQFSGGAGFDGIAVAALGQAHPLGVLASSILLAAVRVGALNGLQIGAGVPRELGGAMIALMMLVVGAGLLAQHTLPRLGLAAGKPEVTGDP